MKARVAVASGYAGGELLRLLLAHPDVEVGSLTAGHNAASREGRGADRGTAVAGAVPRRRGRGEKYGGHAMTDEALKQAFAADMVFLRYVGLKPVVVHGGGPQITAMLHRLGIGSQFHGGLRVTIPQTMDVVRMVLVGQVVRDLVGLITQHGPFAVGMSGEDARLFTAVRRPAHLGARLSDGIAAVCHPAVAGVRGRLVFGVVLTADVAGPARDALLESGFLVTVVAPDVIRLTSPLILTDAQADAFVTALPGALDRTMTGAPA